MRTKLLVILLILISLLLIACDEDSITETALGTNSITLSGVMKKSYEATTSAGVIDDYGSSFFLSMKPKDSDSFEEMFTLSKPTESLPEVGKYEVGEGPFQSGNDFMASYFINGQMYYMSSGTIEITESKSSKIVGNFNLSGYFLEFPIDSTKVLNIVGEFSVVLENL